jgi:hypothetical protein
VSWNKKMENSVFGMVIQVDSMFERLDTSAYISYEIRPI